MSTLETLLSEFAYIAAHPREQLDSYLSQGEKAVGCMPYFCPEELVHAAGMIPFGLWGAETQVSEARRYLPAFICSIIQTTLELGIRGSYNGLSAIMTPILCDSLKSMDGNWRHGVKDIPMIPVAHAQNRKTDAGVEFTASQYRNVRKKLEEISGKSIADSDITASIALYNKRNSAVRRFIDLAADRPGAIKASQRSAVFKSSYFMDVEKYTAKVEELCNCLADMPGAALPETGRSRPAVVTCGIIADNTGLLRILDECGVDVIDDVVTHESLRFRYDTPDMDVNAQGSGDDSCIRLARTISAIEGCPILFDPGKKRFDMLADVVTRRKASGALIVLTEFCDPEEYDIVPLRKALQQKGIKNLTVEVDQQTTDVEQIRTAIETFCEMLLS